MTKEFRANAKIYVVEHRVTRERRNYLALNGADLFKRYTIREKDWKIILFY